MTKKKSQKGIFAAATCIRSSPLCRRDKPTTYQPLLRIDYITLNTQCKQKVYFLNTPGGRSGNRTHTPLLELDFESGASTNSAIRP